MKRIIALLLVLVLFLCSGCSEDQKKGGAPATTPESTPAATTPQEGTLPEDTPTEPAKPAEPTQPAEPFNYEEYLGTYEGEAFLELNCWDEGVLGISYALISEDFERSADFYVEIPISSFVNNKVSFPFTDSWGNQGTMALEFSKDVINATITITKYEESAMYCVKEGQDVFKYRPLEGGSDPGEAVDPYGIKIGDIYYDDIEYALPVSVEQLKEDAKAFCELRVGNEYKQFEIVEFMPIKCDYLEDSNEYHIYVHYYCTYGSTTYEQQHYMRYEHYDVGGWQHTTTYYTDFLRKKTEIQGTVEPFVVSGKKIGNFGYDDYASANMPLSYGEIADDLLYGSLNIFKIDNQIQIFDITSIKVINGKFNDEYFTLELEVGYENSNYTGTVEYKLTYKDYIVGGWEYDINYMHDTNNALNSSAVEDHAFLPKVGYSGGICEKTLGENFTSFTLTNRKEKTENNKKIVTSFYDGVRDRGCVTEFYDVVLTSTHTDKWYDEVDVELTGADYSDLIGTWEYRKGDSYIRFNIHDVIMNMNGESWSSSSTAKITYSVEVSGWGSSAYKSGKVTDELVTELGFNCKYTPTYGEARKERVRHHYSKMYEMDLTIASQKIEIVISPESGPKIAGGSSSLGINEGAFKKIS